MKKHIIDTDILPSLPEWAKLVENKTYGKVEFNISNMELYLSEGQKDTYIKGDDLRKEMEDKNPVNFAVLQFFVDNPKLLPKEWKGKYIYGWGTIVQRRDGDFDVPYLCGDDGKVVLRWSWLDNDWYAYRPALRFTSIETSHLNIDPLEPRNLYLEKRIESLENKMEKLQKFLILE